MNRWMKVAGWVFAFSASFAVGAVIAAHSDPFPPGVTDPGAPVTPTRTPSPTPTPTATTLMATLDLQTVHTLYVGGACRTNWRGTLSLQVDSTGTVTGTGTLDLLGGLHCDFPVVQVQAKTITVSVAGSVKGQRVSLTLTDTGRDPKASSDFGGLAHTVEFLKLSAATGGSQQVHAYRSDGDRGGYTATGTFAVS